MVEASAHIIQHVATRDGTASTGAGCRPPTLRTSVWHIDGLRGQALATNGV